MRAVLASDRLQMDGKTRWFAYMLFYKVIPRWQGRWHWFLYRCFSIAWLYSTQGNLDCFCFCLCFAFVCVVLLFACLFSFLFVFSLLFFGLFAFVSNWTTRLQRQWKMFKLQNGLLSYVKVIQGNSIECIHLSWQNPSLPPSSTIYTLTAFAARHLTSWLFNFCIC